MQLELQVPFSHTLWGLLLPSLGQAAGLSHTLEAASAPWPCLRTGLVATYGLRRLFSLEMLALAPFLFTASPLLLAVTEVATYYVLCCQ